MEKKGHVQSQLQLQILANPRIKLTLTKLLYVSSLFRTLNRSNLKTWRRQNRLGWKTHCQFMALLNRAGPRAWYWINLCSNNNQFLDDYHITPDQLFRRPRAVESTIWMNMPQSGSQMKEEHCGNKNEGRLSFDFCELSADQLLESTPASYRNDRASGPLFPMTKETRLQHE